jgi:hypothetical protein
VIDVLILGYSGKSRDEGSVQVGAVGGAGQVPVVCGVTTSDDVAIDRVVMRRT